MVATVDPDVNIMTSAAGVQEPRKEIMGKLDEMIVVSPAAAPTTRDRYLWANFVDGAERLEGVAHAKHQGIRSEPAAAEVHHLLPGRSQRGRVLPGRSA